MGRPGPWGGLGDGSQQRAGADRTTTAVRVYCSARCERAIRAETGSREETGQARGVGRAGGRGQCGARECGLAGLPGGLLSCPVWDLFVLRHPAGSIVMSHNTGPAQHPSIIRVASLIKGRKQSPDLHFFLQKRSRPFHSAWPCFPCLP